MIKIFKYLSVIIALSLSISSISHAGQTEYCGTVSGRSFSVTSPYLFFPPEREGDSWTPRPPNTEGCKQKIKSFVVNFYHPTMEPAGGGKDFNSELKTNHAQFVVAPLTRLNHYNLFLDRNVGDLIQQQEKLGVNKQGFYSYKGKGLVYDNTTMEVYWTRDSKGDVDQFIYCSYRTLSPLSRCNMRYIDTYIPAQTMIDFYYELLPEVEALRSETTILIHKFFKDSE
jgi:hypothetical protein